MFGWVFMCFPNVSKTICGLHDKFYVASKDRISQWSLSFFFFRAMDLCYFIPIHVFTI